MSNKLTAQQIIDKADRELKPKIAVLTSNITKLQGAPNAEQLLTANNNAQIIRAMMETLKTDIKNIAERPVPEAAAKNALKLVKELQGPYNTIIADVINNKAAITSLPVASLTPIIKQSMQDMLNTITGLADAIIEITPSDLLVEAKTLRKEYEDAIKKVLTVYQ